MRFGKSYVWFREDASMLRFVSAVALSLLAGPAFASPFYVGAWSSEGGENCYDSGVVFTLTPYSMILDDMGECRLSNIEEDGNTATATAICTDESGPSTDSVLFELTDDGGLRITNANRHNEPDVYRRCSP
jgi:hypothetical protein